MPTANRQRLPTACCRLCALILAVAWILAADASAQDFATCQSQKSWTVDRIGKDYVKLKGQAEVECGDMKFYADEYIEIFADKSRLVAVGNVVFTQGGNRISGDRVEFDYQKRTGIFYNAYGISSLGAQADRSMFGTLEPDIMFYGETLEKVAADKYVITRGGFTTCVQPSPRWQVVSGSATIRLEHYALLRNSIFKVKGVPVLYLPIFYYPVKKDDRATGFLIPAYGFGTIKGQTISNAFFWAINRSQDATIFHDWYSKTGQGYGADYRYAAAPGSDGSIRTSWLNEHETSYTVPGSTGAALVPGRRSYTITGGVNQALPGRLRARGRADYFSDITVQQTYNTNIYAASQTRRTFSGAVSGAWGAYVINGAFDRTETFVGTANSAVTGNFPRVSGSRAERPIGNLPLYFSVTGDHSRLIRQNKTSSAIVDKGLSRTDLVPVVRVPFTRWPFFTINSSLAWRNTYWSESRAGGAQIEQPISRRFFDFQAFFVGPTVYRIWNTPHNGYAEKFKHTVEPFLQLQRTSPIDNFDRIVQLDGIDGIIGNMTRLGYGVNNRFYAKVRGRGATAQAREIFNVSVRQSYYTDQRAAQFDRLYRTSYSGAPPSHFSPIAITAASSPTDGISATFRTEYDTRYEAFRTMGADATVAVGGWMQTVAGWSQRRFIKGLPGFDDRNRLDHYLNQQTNVSFKNNRVGGVYTFNYDLLRNSFLQQRIMGFYNAQCCGFAAEYQTFDLKRLGARSPLAQDKRFNFSFTLAGIGSFSPMFGALSGSPR